MSRKTKDKRKRSAVKARRGYKQSQTKDDGLKTNSKGEWVATSKRGKQQLKWARKQIVAKQAKAASDEMDRRKKQAVIDAWNKAWLSHEWGSKKCDLCGMTLDDWYSTADFGKVEMDPKQAEEGACTGSKSNE